MPYTEREVKEWYGQNMVWRMVFSSVYSMDESNAQDWTRLKIYNPDTNQLEPAMPEGHVGTPNYENLERLYDAYQKGNLLLYPLGSKQPKKAIPTTEGAGMDWKNVEVERYRDNLNHLEQGMEIPEVPNRGDYVREPSGFKKLMNRLFNLFKADFQAYTDGVRAYDEAVAQRQQAIEFNNTRAARRLAAAIVEYEPQREPHLADENKEQKFREEAFDQRWKLWRLDNAMDVLDTVFAPRPQPSFPQVTSKKSFKGNSLKEDEFREMQAHGYDLPENSKLTHREAATVNLLLSCAPSITIPAFEKIMNLDAEIENQAASGTNMILTGVFFDPRDSLIWEGVHAAYDAAKVAIEAYQNGDPTLLGKYIADGVRNFNQINNTYSDRGSVDKAGFGLMAEQMLNLLNAHPDLMEATGLEQQDMENLQSHVIVSRISRNSLDAYDMLKKAQFGKLELTPEQKAKCIADIGLNTMMYQCFADDIAAWENSPEAGELLADLMAKRNALDAKLKAAQKGWEKLTPAERVDRQEEWTQKHGKPDAYILSYENARPVCSFQQKLAHPGVGEAIIVGYRTLPTLQENVKDLTPEQLLNIAAEPKKLGELMRKSQDGEKFLINGAPVSQAQKQVNSSRTVNTGAKDPVVPGMNQV